MASGGWVHQNVGVTDIGESGGRDERFAQRGTGRWWRCGRCRSLAAGFVLRGAPEVRALGEVPLQRLFEQGTHRWRWVRWLQGGPHPLRPRQGPRRRWGHAHLAGELLL